MIRFLLILLFAPSLAHGQNGALDFGGDAVLTDGKIFYHEHDLLMFDHGQRKMRTTYADATGKDFAELTSDFKKFKYLPECHFSDQRDHYEYRLKLTGKPDLVEMAVKDSLKAEWKTKEVAIHENTFILQTTHLFIADHLAELLKGNSVDAEMALPSRRSVERMTIEPDLKASKPSALLLRIKASSFLVRAILPEMTLIFDPLLKRVSEFRGISNLLDESDHSQKITIQYRYQGSDEKQDEGGKAHELPPGEVPEKSLQR
jgi:hypothetical protein